MCCVLADLNETFAVLKRDESILISFNINGSDIHSVELYLSQFS